MPDNTKPPSLFANPYAGIEKTKRFHRIGVSISIEDNILKHIRPAQGTIDGTINTLYKKLINELRKRGITDLTRSDDFEDFIVRCELVLPEERGGHSNGGPGSTSSSPVSQAEASHDGGGVTGGHTTIAQPPGQSGDVRSSSKRRTRSTEAKGF